MFDLMSSTAADRCDRLRAHYEQALSHFNTQRAILTNIASREGKLSILSAELLNIAEYPELRRIEDLITRARQRWERAASETYGTDAISRTDAAAEETNDEMAKKYSDMFTRIY